MESQKQTQEDKTCKRDDLSKKRQQTDSFPSQSSQLHAVEENHYLHPNNLGQPVIIQDREIQTDSDISPERIQVEPLYKANVQRSKCFNTHKSAPELMLHKRSKQISSSILLSPLPSLPQSRTNKTVSSTINQRPNSYWEIYSLVLNQTGKQLSLVQDENSSHHSQVELPSKTSGSSSLTSSELNSIEKSTSSSKAGSTGDESLLEEIERLKKQMQISLEEIKRLKIENSLKDKIIQSKEEKIQELEVKDTLPKQTHAQNTGPQDTVS